MDYSRSSATRNPLPVHPKFTFAASIDGSPTKASMRASPVRNESPLSERVAARRNVTRQSPIKTRALTSRVTTNAPASVRPTILDSSARTQESSPLKRRLDGSPPKLFPSPQSLFSISTLNRDVDSDKENAMKKRRKVVPFKDNEELRTYEPTGGDKPGLHTVVASLQAVVRQMQADYSNKITELHTDYSARISELEKRLDEQDRIISRLLRR